MSYSGNPSVSGRSGQLEKYKSEETKRDINYEPKYDKIDNHSIQNYDTDSNYSEELNNGQNRFYSTDYNQISINNYDPMKRTSFTDYGTIEALRQLGIKEEELFMPTQQEMNKMIEYSKDNDIKQLFIQHYQQRIAKLRDQISKKRDEILDKECNGSVRSRSVNNDGPYSSRAYIQNEVYSIDKAKDLHVREL